MSIIEDDGAISVEGEKLGTIKGLSFVPEAAFASAEARLLKAAATQALALEITNRARALAMTADPELRLTRLGDIIWQGHVVGKVIAGDATYRPRIEVVADDVLPAAEKDAARERLEKFMQRQIETLIGPLLKLEEPDGIDGMARGLAFRISESFGVLPRDAVNADVKGLGQEDRAKLRMLGIRFGAFTVFAPVLLKPAATDLRLLLWSLKNRPGNDIPAAPANGLTSLATDAAKPEGYYQICGYRICGPRAVRVDMLERLADMIRDRVFWKPRIPEEARPGGSAEGGGFTITPDLMSLVGCSGDDFKKILESLGFRPQTKMLPKPVAVVVPQVAEPEVVAEAPIEEAPAIEAEPAAEPEAVVAEAPPAAEMIEVEVWWPKDTGPFRHEHRKAERKPHQGKGRRPEGQQNRPDKARHKRHGEKPDGERRGGEKREKPKRAERAERPPDPNSPFAVLQALKAGMKGERS